VKVFRLDLVPEAARELAAQLDRVVAAGLVHEAIVRPLAAGVEGTVAYLALEYVAAESLDVALRHYAPARLQTVLPFAWQLAGAIDAARERGFGHGALHPRDIFVTPEQARATGVGVIDALERIGVRAPVRRPYSAPERIAGGARGTAADVYSLAAITYELLTARRIAGSGDRLDGLAEVRHASVDRLKEVFTTALAEAAADRYGTATAFASALEACAGSEPRPVPRAALDPSRLRESPQVDSPLLRDAPIRPVAPVPDVSDEDISWLDKPRLGDPPDRRPGGPQAVVGGTEIAPWGSISPEADRRDADEPIPADEERLAGPTPVDPGEPSADPHAGGAEREPDRRDRLGFEELQLGEDDGDRAQRAYPAPMEFSDIPPVEPPASRADAGEHGLFDFDLPADPLPGPPLSSWRDRDERGAAEGERPSAPVAPIDALDEAQPAERPDRADVNEAEPDREPAEPSQAAFRSTDFPHEEPLARDALDPDEDVATWLPPPPEPEPLASAEPEEERVEETTATPPLRLPRQQTFEPAFNAWHEPPPVRSSIGRVVAALIVGVGIGLFAGYRLWGVEPPVEPPPAKERGAQATAGSGERRWSESAVPEGSRPAETTGAATPGRSAPADRSGSAAPPRAVASAPAEPAPAPVPRRGRLIVRSTPPGARVAIDEVVRGITPLDLPNLALGSYTIRVSRQGYEDQTRRVSLTARAPAATSAFRLRAEPSQADSAPPAPAPARGVGSLVVDSRPRGARVLLDGQLAGTTPLNIAELKAGPRRVRLELPGYRPWESTVSIAAGRETRVAGSLEPQRQ
jgi:serine/threonine protein kinase